jgi:hypothetical protein
LCCLSISFSDLAGLREEKALTALPAAERRAWQQLWADVAATLAQAQEQRRPQDKASPAQGPQRD